MHVVSTQKEKYDPRLETVNQSGENRPASTLDLHSRHHLYNSKRVNPPEVTINNELKPANAMYIGQQFQVMRTFMSTCEFHPAVNAAEPQRKKAQKKKHTVAGFCLYIYLIYVIFMIHRPTIYYSSLESEWFTQII